MITTGYMQMRRFTPKFIILYPVFLIMSSTALLALAEILSRFYLQGNKDFSIEFDRSAIYDDKHIYFRLKPNSAADHIYRFKGDIIRKIRYSINPSGWRTTTPESDGKSQHLMLWGCSNVFGEGLNDNETLASVLSSKLDKYHVYNFGMPGTAINYSLFAFKNMNTPVVSQTEGKLIYFFYSFHYPRILPTLKWHRAGRSPKYFINESESLVNEKDNSPWDQMFALSSLIRRKSSLLDIIGFDWPPVNLDTVKLTAQLFESFRNEYLSRFPEGDFFVIIHHLIYPQYRKPLLSELRKRKIEYLDLTDVMTFDGVMPPIEKHPSYTDNLRLADLLSKSLL